MKVKCIANSGRNLPLGCIKPEWGFTKNKEYALLVGKTYTVYAFTILFGYVWYYICDENYSFYPIWNPAPLFTIVDHRLSSCWEICDFVDDIPEQTRVIVAFPEWAKDRLYYDRLTNGMDKDVKVFGHYKTLIDVEYPAN